MRPIEFIGSLALLATCLSLLAACSSGGGARQVVPGTEDLRMGRLGHWLGTYLAIGGVRETLGIVGPGQMLVDTVDGARLDPPVWIWIEGVSLTAGERVELKGYESGRFTGMPEGVASATGLPRTQAGWQFHNYFIVTSIESGARREK